ncbi:jg8974 [Pararge aegeria aegeria]|uniref:Jg8974 protein n=1 Tax=Pararge aegeria aegeria TaxID=348720 RepID=A0A8S4R4R1_9NEOP|nr:jg8974 [Pararge aegeria aegeria]
MDRKAHCSVFGYTIADNHLRGCYGDTGGVGRVRELENHEKSPRARQHRGGIGGRRPESASFEDSELGSVRLFGYTIADNHLRGCYGDTGRVGRARELENHEKSPRARRHQGGIGGRRPESASFEDSELGSVRR